jgi:rhodanese-related sulfurtransferase
LPAIAARPAATRPAPPPGAALALERASNFAHETGVKTIDAAGLAALRADTSRTTYCLDVRSPAEYQAGHLPGFRHAPGGQLIQATDQWVAVRRARIVLTDLGDGARARMSAAWLRLLGGWEVFVLDGAAGALETGPEPSPAVPPAPTISVAELAARPGAHVIDLARSIDFRDGHIPGAVWGVRTRLSAPPAGVPLVAVTAPREALAHLAAADLAALTSAPVRVLEGGTAAWAAAGHQLEADRQVPADAACIDFYLRPYDRNSGIEEAMREYLSWEIDLVHEVERDGDAGFGRL